MSKKLTAHQLQLVSSSSGTCYVAIPFKRNGCDAQYYMGSSESGRAMYVAVYEGVNGPWCPTPTEAYFAAQRTAITLRKQKRNKQRTA